MRGDLESLPHEILKVALLQESDVFGELSALGRFTLSVSLQAFGITTVREISCDYLKKVL